MRGFILTFFLQDYNEFIKTFSKMSRPCNMLVGLLYTISPIIFSQTHLLFTKQSLNKQLETVSEYIITLVIIFIILFYYIVNHLANTLTKANESIAKYLYPVFNDTKFNRTNNQMMALNRNYISTKMTNISIHMKIDSFVARLNEEYIGYYCFNSFEFTKLAFFQFLYMIMSDYVLIRDLL